MKSRWLLLSVSLNLLLLGVVVHATRRAPDGLEDRSPAVLLTQRVVRAVSQSVPAPQPQTTLAQVEESFHWSQLESADYRVYAANLRAIGCPEATVRDIIEADVNKLFHQRVKEMVDLLQPRFWHLVSSHSALEELVNEKEAELGALENQRDALLDEVLGKPARQPGLGQELAALEQLQGRKQFLEFLPPDKLAQCLAMDEKFRQLQEALANGQPPLPDQERRAKFKALREQQDREFQELLSPEERAEYALRNSRFADLRLQLPGFELTEEEVKQIVRIREQSVVDTAKPRSAETQQQSRESVRTLLGEQRFAEFERVQDLRYREIYQLANRLELPAQAAVDAYAMRQAAEEQVRRIRQDQTLPPELRAEQLKAIRAETERSVAGVLGAEAFKVYQTHAGGWLTDLEKRKP